ncbi:hypothetical protein F-LCD7_0191 [Faustovirus]|nr:hypothetical protein F-LCD7_0191 [Faustovirus]
MHMNRSLQAAIGICVTSTVLFVVGFALIYSLDDPSRLHWCNKPEILNCTVVSTNNVNSDSLQTTYTDVYRVRYNVSGCIIETNVVLIDNLPCDAAAGGRVIDNGIVCYIEPDCQLNTDKVGAVLTVMVVSSALVVITLLAFIAILLLKFIPMRARRAQSRTRDTLKVIAAD